MKKGKHPRRKTKSESRQLDRRGFMRLAGLGAGVAGASAGLVESGAGATEAAASEEHAGYRETEHVRTYYRIARS